MFLFVPDKCKSRQEIGFLRVALLIFFRLRLGFHIHRCKNLRLAPGESNPAPPAPVVRYAEGYPRRRQ